MTTNFHWDQVGWIGQKWCPGHDPLWVVALINSILRGWVSCFDIGDASRCFDYVKEWVEKKVRRHLRRARGLRGFGWDRWSRRWLYEHLGLLSGYRLCRPPKALPTG